MITYLLDFFFNKNLIEIDPCFVASLPLIFCLYLKFMNVLIETVNRSARVNRIIMKGEANIVQRIRLL